MAVPEAWHALARALIGEPELAAAEVARRAGTDLEQARLFWRALGFPPVADDERIFTRRDLEVLAAVRARQEQGTIGLAEALRLTRVMGQALARIADAQVATLPLDRVPDVAAMEALVPQLEGFLVYVWRRQVFAALLRATAREAVSDTRLVVGFADLVSFTEVAQHLSEGELAELVERFEALAYARIPDLGGRIVKTIGDAVMFAVDDPRAAARVALDLVDAAAGDAMLPDLRVGLAVGPTVAYEGDLFGQTVNLASRLVTLARPRTVLASDELGVELAADPAFRLQRLRPRLKGIGRVSAWVVRRAPAAHDARR